MLTKEEYSNLLEKEERTEEDEAAIKEYDGANSNGKNGKDKPEHMIPKSRFDEVNHKYKELQDQINAINEANRKAEEQRLVEAQKYQELAEKRQQDIEALKPKAAVAEEAEKVLSDVLDAQIEDIPEDLRSLVPDDMTVSQKLKWLSKNKHLLMKQESFDIGANKRGAPPPPDDDSKKLSPEELEICAKMNITPKDYLKYKKLK